MTVRVPLLTNPADGQSISFVCMTESSRTKLRSRNMSAIRSKNTQPELLWRRAIHAAGFRYTLHNKRLPGTPDLVLRKHQVAIFIHGCFWHVHDCRYFKWPRTRADFWREKLLGNVDRDAKAASLLLAEGWRVAVVWECALRSTDRTMVELVDTFVNWLATDQQCLHIEE